jgi:hypothetical protein
MSALQDLISRLLGRKKRKLWNRPPDWRFFLTPSGKRDPALYGISRIEVRHETWENSKLIAPDEVDPSWDLPLLCWRRASEPKPVEPPAQMDDIEFDEEYYLNRYPDVARAVRAGGFASGRAHYVSAGQKEGRFPMPPSP